MIVGAAAGALIGLQFVVLTLLAQRPLPKDAAEGGAVLLTPAIVHFGAALLLSALLSAPWQTIGILEAIITVIGFVGVAYMGVVAYRMRRERGYTPVLEDWVLRIVLPLIAYATLALFPLAGLFFLNDALFAVGAAALLLLLIGIHNAWDNIIYTVFVHHPEE